MALGRAFSVAVRGLDGEIVEIEADITSGLPGVHLVGLPDAALQESRDRVRAAITNCGHSWPMARLTLALSPATLPKMGSVYDLALASAVLSAHGKKRGSDWKRPCCSANWHSTEGASRQGGAAGRARRQAGRLAGRGGPGRQSGGSQPRRRHRRVGRTNIGAIANLVDRAAQLDDRIDAPSSAPEPAVDLAEWSVNRMPGSRSRSPRPAPIT